MKTPPRALTVIFAVSLAACGGAVASEDVPAAQSGPGGGAGGAGSGDGDAKASVDGGTDGGASGEDAAPPDAGPPTWHVESTSAPGSLLTAVWGATSTNVYVVGEAGTILHRVQNAWVPEPSGTATHLSSVWGRSATDLFVGGQGIVLRSTGNGAWRSEKLPFQGAVVALFAEGTNVLAAVEGGYFVRSDGGGAWNVVEGSSTSVIGAARVAGGGVYAVGPSGNVHLGVAKGVTAWTAQTSNVPTYEIGCETSGPPFPCDPYSYTPALYGVWASGASDVYAVGDYGTIVHSNGVAWTFENGAKSLLPRFLAVGGTARDDVYAVGDVVLRSNGDGVWQPVDVGANDAFRAIWTTGRDVYVVGGHTIVHRY